MNREIKKAYFKYFWWIWQTILIIVCGFFLALGVEVFIYSYRLPDPFDFILSFFASNLIILISAVILAGIVYRMVGVYRIIKKMPSVKQKSMK